MNVLFFTFICNNAPPSRLHVDVVLPLWSRKVQQSDRVAAQEQEIWTAKVRAVLASMTWKSGRRRKRSAARAVVGAERVGGGEAAAARAPSTKRGRTSEPDAKQGQFDPGGKTQRTQYGRSYPALDLSPVRREGSTGPERPQRRRPDGQDAGVLCGEQASGSQEEEDRKR